MRLLCFCAPALTPLPLPCAQAAVLEASGLAGAHYLGLTPPPSPDECPLLAVLALLLCDLRADAALRSAAAAALAAEDELRRCDAAAEEADAANVFIPQDARDAVAAEADLAASRAAAAAAAVVVRMRYNALLLACVRIADCALRRSARWLRRACAPRR